MIKIWLCWKFSIRTADLNRLARQPACRWDFRLPRADMLAQYSPHFFDGLRVPLGRVTGASDLFRLHAVNMSTLVSDHPVGFAVDRAVAEHGNDLEVK